MDQDIVRIYGERVRVRVCGICRKEGAILMVNHKGIAKNDFWSPPGGGVEFGNTIQETLRKEFVEETGLLIEPGRFLFGCEFIRMPLHAIELFYEVALIGGVLTRGNDPELEIITDVRFMSFEEIKKLRQDEVHGIFRLMGNGDGLGQLSGFYSV